MIVLVTFAFIAGVITILSPCILPLLPIILSSSSTSKKRPLGIMLGFIASFTFFTLFLSTIVSATGISADLLRSFSIVVLLLFGLTLIIPGFQILIEKLFVKLTRFAPKQNGQNGFIGGFTIGLSLGLLWTPCVGPILASVISLAISGTVTAQAFLLTLAYATGTAIPMLGIMLAGSTALQRVPWLVRNSAKIQKLFGVLMILTAIGIYLNVDRKFQSYILKTFPNYGAGLTKIEDNKKVIDELLRINEKPIDEDVIGKPMSDLSLPKGPIAPELIAGGLWFNSDPLQLASLRGKVVIVDFWTYSCINCQRTLPYLRSWYEKYREKGLVIIGVHSPEFEFEKNPDNVSQAIRDFEIKYPVMQDNNFATWRAYSNRYWPAKYFIDKDGYIRYTHFGEGAYDESEKVIQELLREAGSGEISDDISNPSYKVYGKTPETYLGYKRMDRFYSLEKIVKDNESTYTFPARLPNNNFAFSGTWTVTPEYSLAQKGAKLKLSFEAKEVFLVMRPKAGNPQVVVRLDNDNNFLGQDVIDGFVTITKDSLYKLIRLDTSGKHELLLEFVDGDVEVYAFTFG